MEKSTVETHLRDPEQWDSVPEIPFGQSVYEQQMYDGLKRELGVDKVPKVPNGDYRCEQTGGILSGCAGLPMLMFSYKKSVIEKSNEQTGKKESTNKIEFATDKVVPFKIVRPWFTAIVELYEVLKKTDITHADAFIAFQCGYVNHFSGTSNGQRFRPRRFNHGPAFCRKCFSKLIAFAKFPNKDDTTAMQVWLNFHNQWLNKHSDKEIADRPQQSVYVSGMMSSSWIHEIVWDAFVEVLTSAERHDLLPSSGDIEKLLEERTALNLTSTTVNRDYIGAVNLFKHGVAMCIADPKCVVKGDTVLLELVGEYRSSEVIDDESPLLEKHAYEQGGRLVKYDNDFHVVGIETHMETVGELLKLIVGDKVEVDKRVSGIASLFSGGVAVSTGITTFIETVLVQQARQFMSATINNYDARMQQFELTYDVSFSRRDLDYSATGYSYRTPRVHVPLDKLDEMEKQGHRVLVAVVPFDDAWVRIFPEAPIKFAPCESELSESASASGESASSESAFQLDSLKEAKWAHTLPYLHTTSLNKQLRQNKQVRTPVASMAANVANAANVAATHGIREGNRRAKRAKRDEKYKVLKPTTTRDTSSTEMVKAGGLMNGAFVYIKKGCATFFPARLFHDAYLRTSPHGNPHLQFVFIIEDKEAKKCVSDILGCVSSRSAQYMIAEGQDKSKLMPMKTTAQKPRRQTENYVAEKESGVGDWITPAALRFAETFVM